MQARGSTIVRRRLLGRRDQLRLRPGDRSGRSGVVVRMRSLDLMMSIRNALRDERFTTGVVLSSLHHVSTDPFSPFYPPKALTDSVTHIFTDDLLDSSG